MKRIIIAISIIVITLSLSLGEYITIKNNLEKYTKKLQICEDYISDNELKSMEAEIKNTEKEWQKSENFLNFFINHNEVDRIKENFQNLCFYAEINDTKAFVELCENTKRQLLSIKERQLPYLKNIV